jgi:hypothetical protein
MRALSTPDIHAMVDAAEGTGSLADNDDFRLAAEGLQRLGTWNATITERTLGPWQGEAIGGLLRPYAVMAHGDRYGDGKRYFAVALVHRTAEDAAENARRLPARIGPAQRAVAEQAARISGRVAEWDKVISDVDVETDGRLLLATLRFDEFDPSGGFGSFFLRLLAHE